MMIITAHVFRLPLWTLLSSAVYSASAAAKVECPPEIAPSSIQVATTSDWKPFIQFPLHLNSAGISAGPPDSLAVLRGVPLNKKGQPQSTRFTFGELGFEQGKWLNCGYGAASEITLSKRLDDQLQECTVSYLKAERTNKQSIHILCK